MSFPVEAEHAGRRLRADAKLSSDVDGEQIIRLEKYETATITGRIVDTAQSPVQDAELQLVTYGRDRSSIVPSPPCRTGSDGVFVIKDIIIGKQHRLYVDKEHYIHAEIHLPDLKPGLQTLDDTVIKKFGQ